MLLYKVLALDGLPLLLNHLSPSLFQRGATALRANCSNARQTDVVLQANIPQFIYLNASGPARLSLD